MGWVQDLSSHEPRTRLGKILADSIPPNLNAEEASENRTKRRCRSIYQGRKPFHESKKRQYITSLPRSRKMRIWVKEFFVALAIARYAAVEKSLAPRTQRANEVFFSFIVNFSSFFSETDLWARTFFRRSANVERLSCDKMNACLSESER